MPFPIGEKIQYKVRWEMVSAGKAGFEILPFTTVENQESCHFLLTVESNRYIDMFFKIRDRHEGFTDKNLTRSLLYHKLQKGSDKRDSKILFNFEKNTAQYSNSGQMREPIKIPPQTFDPLSAFYKMRSMDFKAGQELAFPVTNGKKYFIQEARIEKKETITVSGREYETWPVSLAVNHFSGVFEKSDNPGVKIWATADEKKIPVRIKIKIFIGSVVFDLENYFAG